MLALGVRNYADHMGTLPAALTVLMRPAVNDRNQSAGPFIATVPPPPYGGTPAWGAYAYTSSSTGTFSVTATGGKTRMVLAEWKARRHSSRSASPGGPVADAVRLASAGVIG
jgi:hypothetical protein